jgi:hypothetical protein
MSIVKVYFQGEKSNEKSGLSCVLTSFFFGPKVGINRLGAKERLEEWAEVSGGHGCLHLYYDTFHFFQPLVVKNLLADFESELVSEAVKDCEILVDGK